MHFYAVFILKKQPALHLCYGKFPVVNKIKTSSHLISTKGDFQAHHIISSDIFRKNQKQVTQSWNIKNYRNDSSRTLFYSDIPEKSRHNYFHRQTHLSAHLNTQSQKRRHTFRKKVFPSTARQRTDTLFCHRAFNFGMN